MGPEPGWEGAEFLRQAVWSILGRWNTLQKSGSWYHLTPTRMATLEKNPENVSVVEDARCVAGNAKWWECKMVQLLQETVWRLFQMRTRITIRPGDLTSGYRPQRLENGVSRKYLHAQIHSSRIRHSQEVEPTQASTNGCMERQTAVRSPKETLLSLNTKDVLPHAPVWMTLRTRC